MQTSSLLRLLGGLILAALLAGCETLEPNPLANLERVQPQSEYFAGSKDKVFAAMERVLEERDYTVSRSLPAQGILEGYSRLLDTAQFGASRQFQVYVRLWEAGDEVTAVEMLIKEAKEGDFKVGAVSRTHAQHGRYESLYEALAEALGEGSWLPPGPPES